MTRRGSAVPDAPGPLRGVEGLTGPNEARLIWWAIRARLHGTGWRWLAMTAIATAAISAWTARSLGTVTAGTIAAIVLVVFPLAGIALIAAVQLIANGGRRWRGWLVGYFTDNATQLVHPDPSGRWILSDHFARRRGHGLAATFRRRVFAHLADEADRHQAVIVMDTHAQKLAQIYSHDMPGLRVVEQRRTINGHTWALQRDPYPASS